jgi:hypothetical protein
VFNEKEPPIIIDHLHYNTDLVNNAGSGTITIKNNCDFDIVIFCCNEETIIQKYSIKTLNYTNNSGRIQYCRNNENGIAVEYSIKNRTASDGTKEFSLIIILLIICFPCLFICGLIMVVIVGGCIIGVVIGIIALVLYIIKSVNPTIF